MPQNAPKPGNATVNKKQRNAEKTNADVVDDRGRGITGDLEDEPAAGGDQDIDTAGTEADRARVVLERKTAEAADEAGSAFLPHDRLVDSKDRKGRP